MTTPASPYIRLVAGGLIRSVQTWSTGLSMAAGPGPYSQTDLQTLLAAFQTAFNAFWDGTALSGLGNRNAPAVDLRTYRAYLYAVPGAPVSLQAAIDQTPKAGTATGFIQPPQCAVVVGLRTGFPGRSFRGRMYLPTTSQTLDATGQISTTSAQGLATAVANLISGLNARTGSSAFGKIVVAGAAGNVPVSSVQVDTEIDIQRRRADKILGNATTTAAVTP